MQDLARIADAAANRAFPQAAARRAADKYAVIGEESAPQLGLQPREELGEVGGAVADHPGGLRFQDLLAHFHWTGQKQARVVGSAH